VKYALIALAAVLLIALILVAVGASLPVQHRASREASYHRPASDLFRLINTPGDFPAWRPSVTSVKILPDAEGRPRFQESGKNGSILYEVERTVPGQMLITRIADRSLPFGGTWTYTLTPDGDSTTLRIVEDGEVYNPIFRFISRFVLGHNATMDQFLRDVGKKVGEENIVVRNGQ
jgi:hypothetical protein